MERRSALAMQKRNSVPDAERKRAGASGSRERRKRTKNRVKGKKEEEEEAKEHGWRAECMKSARCQCPLDRLACLS